MGEVFWLVNLEYALLFDDKVFHMYKIIIPIEPKQETLDEAIERLIKLNRQDAFYEGAKWQQETMYSEEEVLEILEDFEKERSTKVIFAKQWFNKFKK